jgi:peptide/nickel transport system substrate-binding protein
MRTAGTGWHRRTRRAFVAAGALTLAIALTACGGGGSDGSPSSEGTFVMATQALPDNLDIKDFSGGTRPLMSLLGSQLFNYHVTSCDQAPSADNLTGVLAEKWSYAPDRKSIDITLKDDIKSNYGNELTSEDVKWSLERGRALSPIVGFLSTASAHWAAKDPITVVSDQEFTLNLDAPTPVDLAMWTVPTFTIFDSQEAKKHATEDDPWANAWLSENSAGFGPWQVASVDTGNQITFEKNPGWPTPLGSYNKVVLKQITSSSDQAQLLNSGSVNYARNLTWGQFADMDGSSSVDVYPCSPISRDWLILNFKRPELADVRVRTAISEAIDRDELVKGAYAGQGTPALTGLLESEIPEGAQVEQTKYDLEHAQQLMAEAGYADGFDLTLNYNPVQPGSQVDQLAILLQSQLKQIGINLKLNKLASGNDLQTTHAEGNYEAELWSSSSAMPSTYFDAGLIQPGSPNTTWGYDSEEYVELMNQLGGAEPGSPEADDAAIKIANLNITDMPVVQLVSTPNIFAMTAGLGGIENSLGTIMIQPQPAGLTAP